ncbi:hypothetical protein FRB90_001860 [Tulasnella sp. 427]|nr:hypothetical protein FRB90_001860 [Tulasnella sp. 427]
MEQVEFAYSLYENTDPANTPRARKFKEAFSSDVTVDFVGVWHALALDERRVKFQPNAWQYKRKCTECGSAARTQDSSEKDIRELTSSRDRKVPWTVESKCWCQDERQYHGGALTDVREVWFPGFHADVGGGNELNTFRVSLANPSLRWMVTEILKDSCKIVFKRDAFLEWLPSLNARIHAFGAVSINAPVLPSRLLDRDEDGDQDLQPVMERDPSVILPLYSEGNPAFQGKKVRVLDEPILDDEAVARMNDMMREKPWWWIVEFLPAYQYWLGKDKTTTIHRYALNLGFKRKIDHRIPLLHKCVEERQARDHTYKPEKRCTFKDRIVYVHEDDDISAEMKNKIKIAEKAMKIIPHPALPEQPKSHWKRRVLIAESLALYFFVKIYSTLAFGIVN